LDFCIDDVDGSAIFVSSAAALVVVELLLGLERGDGGTQLGLEFRKLGKCEANLFERLSAPLRARVERPRARATCLAES
jgi:hypothetical protein